MSFDDDFDLDDGFEPDEPSIPGDYLDDLERFFQGDMPYLPDDFIQPLLDYDNPGNIRWEPFPTIEDALERIYGTGAFPYVTILVDDMGYFYIAVGYGND